MVFGHSYFFVHWLFLKEAFVFLAKSQEIRFRLRDTTTAL